MEFEKELKNFEDDGKKLIENKKIMDIIFSDNIYEIEILDPNLNQSFWPFLQISDDKNIIDAFCSCKTQEKKGFCAHLAAAYFFINQKEEPIHVRFKKSFFNAIFKIASFHIGFDKNLLKKEKKGVYSFFSKTKQELFYIEAKDKEIFKLEEFLKDKKAEQNLSIKFSGISLDEMNLLKEGRASKELKYEISFFADLAKWFFLLSDTTAYKIDFKDKKDFLYSKIIVTFKNILARFYVPLVSWHKIIPTLNTVKSPLALYEFQGKKINKIIYDKEKKCFFVEKTKGFFAEEKKDQKGKNFGDYIYIEDVGFYSAKPDELAEVDIIEKEKISYFLSKYKNIFEEKLENEKIYTKPIEPRYFLFFDENENLHINAYVFEKFDLDMPFSYYFGPWVYLEEKGFYLLEELYFKTKEKVVLKQDISDFITRHRIWLHNFQGFQTHFGSIESHLVYSFNDDQDLVFSSKLNFPQELGSFIDFDEWIYIKGIGFFSKKEKGFTLPIRPGLIIKKNEIAKFIETNKDELEQIENFFIDQVPIEKIGLNIYLNEDLKIAIKPEIKVKKNINLNQLHFFENFAYLENKGFFEIPKALKLPPRYSNEKIIPRVQEYFFITFEIERLKSYIIYLDERLKKPKSLILKLIKINKRKRKGKSIYLIDLAYQSEIGSVHSIDIYKAMKENKKYIFSEAGLVILKQARFNWLKNIKKPKLTKFDKFLEFSSLDIIRLFLLEDVKISKTKTAQTEQTRKLLDELNTFETDKFFDISYLKASLRPYQEIGMKWLWFLYVNNLSGLLCDDMGLGKTHQSMALIAALQKENSFKYLVVCPTSVIYHWEELLKKFLPTLKVYVYYGISRKLENFANYDLLLTSYGIVRSEKDKLKKLKFEIAIFDEIQIAKNAKSLTHKALSSINSNMRVGLTGTPIENYLTELKALFDLVLPSYLPQAAVFKEFFINPIEKENDMAKKKLLKKLIKPFILRRKKKDVLFDLPEKIEELAYAELSQEQARIYNDIISESKKTILKDLKDEAKPISYIHIFSILAKLKQICDHPSLILKDIDRYQDHESGKFELFIELLNEAKESSQKVVIFSQYLDMIKIIKKYLKKKSIGFASITGTTKKRFDEIKRFKQDPNCLVFIASLLAAGIGIDLSCASVVIHYDRWWNPAKENQATDRVHRIGQNRGVQVFKLITKNTIEQRIHNIIERKQTLIEETIGKDEVDQIKSLTRQDLIEVLEKIEPK